MEHTESMHGATIFFEITHVYRTTKKHGTDHHAMSSLHSVITLNSLNAGVLHSREFFIYLFIPGNSARKGKEKHQLLQTPVILLDPCPAALPTDLHLHQSLGGRNFGNHCGLN